MQQATDGYAVPIKVESVALVSDCSCCRKIGRTHTSIQRKRKYIPFFRSDTNLTEIAARTGLNHLREGYSIIRFASSGRSLS